MAEELIETIIKSLEGLAICDDPETASVFASALSSAKASSSRALIPDTRLGALARYSVAASASSSIRPYLASGTRSGTRDALMRDALKAALKLANRSALPKNDDVPEFETPEGWDRAENGSYTLQTPMGTAEISFSPHMPGGEWTLSLCGIPIGFGSTPIETALQLTRVVEFVSTPMPRRFGNAFGARRNA